MTRFRQLVAALAVATLGFGVLPEAALAGSPDAKIDQQIRPCFGLLLEPNLSTGCRVKHYRKPKPRYGAGYGHGRGGRYRTFVDCDRAYPGEVSDVLDRLYEGDTLTLRSRGGGACVDSLNVTKSVTIVADGYAPTRGRPILVAPAGQPCIRIAAGVRYVVIEGLGIDALRAGSASCIIGRATELALKNVVVRYDGDASALDLGESRLEASNVTFIGRTRQAVVKATGAIMADNVEVAATAIGAAFEAGEDSRIRDFRVIRLGDWTGSSRSRNSAGFVLAGMNRSQLVQIEGLYVDGFSRGIYVGGGDETTLLRPVVRDSDWAVVLENADLRVLEGKLEATDVGVYAGSGTVYAADNAIAGVMRAGLFADNGAQVRARDNRVYARPGGCEALITGYFDGKLTCQPWFEGPELFRTPRDRSRLDFDGYWPMASLATTAAAAPRLPGDGLAGGLDLQDASAAAGGPVGPGSPQPYAPQGGTSR
ncbi:hypothetical protein ASD79_16985 [Caulobacter sp. Root655]|uniref:hypothetical protein n=1 Tax=Caulobacter sp. Root655 TaxID=1736578 RepID=UPI0006FAA847|nr:hypothetical protein [Caulobacter sp. Root655]KRA56755.1 hypothetical protein ASD79_16985 [Caulobacter sp. Root655]